MNVIGTWWALLPPLVTILLGFITKKVNLSLIIGILLGALLLNTFNPIDSTITTFTVMGEQVSRNIGVIFFVIELGMFVFLLNLSGASQKYADWARKKIKTKKQAMFATFLLGILIFVDDYFNCLTVSTVMKPITDKNKISREKLAYIIDTTAAPICMIAPISSWAAAVSSSLPDGSTIDGFGLFLKTIPANFYSLVSLVMVLVLIIFNFDFGKMRQYEIEAQKRIENETDSVNIKSNARTFDLILPVVVLIVSCILSMLYTGGLFSGKVSFIDAFANCDAIMGLCIGTFVSILFILVLYVPRKIVNFNQYLEGLTEGFKNMVPSVLILCFAWTLGGICGSNYLNAGKFISDLVNGNNVPLTIMPMIFFVFSIILSVSTGTSWGTFAILLPMAVSIFNDQLSSLMVLTVSAVLSGSVCGDHLSPISDTTILSSTGAECPHINHVRSQAPYGILVAIVSFVGYLISGLTSIILVGLMTAIVLLIVSLIVIRIVCFKMEKNKKGEITSELL